MRGDEIEAKLEGLIDDPDELKEALEEVQQLSPDEKAHLDVEAARPSSGSDKVEVVLFGLTLGFIVLASFLVAFFSMRSLSDKIDLLSQSESGQTSSESLTFTHDFGEFSFSHLPTDAIIKDDKGWISVQRTVDEQLMETDIIVLADVTNQRSDLTSHVEETLDDYCNRVKLVEGYQCQDRLSGIRRFETPTAQVGHSAYLVQVPLENIPGHDTSLRQVYFFNLHQPEHIGVIFVSTDTMANDLTQELAASFTQGL